MGEENTEKLEGKWDVLEREREREKERENQIITERTVIWIIYISGHG